MKKTCFNNLKIKKKMKRGKIENSTVLYLYG